MPPFLQRVLSISAFLLLSAASAAWRHLLRHLSSERNRPPSGASESKQTLGIAVIDHVAMRQWAIEPVKELRRHLVGTERMVGPKQQMLRTEHLVATGKRLVVITHGVNIKVGKIVADRTRKARRLGDERGRPAVGFDAALQIGQHSAGMCHDERGGRMFVEDAAVNEA